MKKKSSAIKGRSGFTLLEMMVTVGLIGIMAAIAIPGFSQWIPGYKLKNASRDVFSNMQLAKLEAIKRGSSCAVNIDTGANIYSVVIADGTIIKTVTLADYGSGVIFGGGGVSSSTITFTSRGMATILPVPTDNRGRIYLTNTQNSANYEIVITSTGSMSIDKM